MMTELNVTTVCEKSKEKQNAQRNKQEAQRKDRWLEYHERFTNGIPGLLPLVLNLPVRFTDAPHGGAREQGIFKHARGILRGWELEPDEEERLQSIGDDAEVVLLKRPQKLLIEVPTANETLGYT